MSDTYRVIVPGVPSTSLSPNARVHWRVKARDTKQAREAARWCAVAVLDGRKPFGSDPVDVRVRVLWPKGRKTMDPTNLAASLKATVDGLTDAGAWRDDNRVQIVDVEQVPYGKQDKGTRANWPGGCVVLDLSRRNGHE